MTALDLLALPDVGEEFSFSDEHELTRASARRFLAERCPTSEVRRLMDDPVGHDASTWRSMAELGWLGTTVPQPLGGAALDPLHLALLFEEQGRALLPSPFLACQLALSALELAATPEQAARWIPPILSGEQIATLAFEEPSGASRGAADTRAVPARGGWVLVGVRPHVLGAASAGLVIVPATEPDGGVGLFAVELPHPCVLVEAERSVDTTRRAARLVLEGASVPAAARLERSSRAVVERVEARGRTLLAAEMAGGIAAVLERTRAYACEREQFGRPIGAFQAVKHPIVDTMVSAELARSLALGAAVAWSREPARHDTLSRMAKAYASDAFAVAVRRGVQLHGGYGFTWDCDIQLWFKRAVASRALLGDALHHRRWLAAALGGA
ncbi:MAG: acyl-CoA/acyl-ACP dehydrogenase [Polyangiaceae bacterium]|nr:acyl-CoA/acyl-ACP dehydrogenase [Polyangiaceae bacterium]